MAIHELLQHIIIKIKSKSFNISNLNYPYQPNSTRMGLSSLYSEVIPKIDLRNVSSCIVNLIMGMQSLNKTGMFDTRDNRLLLNKTVQLSVKLAYIQFSCPFQSL